MEERCADRLTLSENVASAIEAVYRTRESYKFAVAQKADKADELRVALSQAREVERIAEGALREHIEQHGCTI
jgi:hypothetical protein